MSFPYPLVLISNPQLDIPVVLILDISFYDTFTGMFRMTDRCCLLFSYLTEKGSSHTEDYPNNSYTCSSKFSCLDICALKL